MNDVTKLQMTTTTAIWMANASCKDNATDSSSQPEKNWAVLGLSVLIVATMGGNILVCIAVCWERRLQNMTNYFLMSLAIADLMVGLLVMPLALVVELYGKLFIDRSATRYYVDGRQTTQTL